MAVDAVCVVMTLFTRGNCRLNVSRTLPCLSNHHLIYSLLQELKFNYIASSDFHEERHLHSWKTLLQCEKNVESVKEVIRKNDRMSLFLSCGGKIK